MTNSESVNNLNHRICSLCLTNSQWPYRVKNDKETNRQAEKYGRFDIKNRKTVSPVDKNNFGLGTTTASKAAHGIFFRKEDTIFDIRSRALRNSVLYKMNEKTVKILSVYIKYKKELNL